MHDGRERRKTDKIALRKIGQLTRAKRCVRHSRDEWKAYGLAEPQRKDALLEMNLESSLNTFVSNTDPKGATTSSTPQISIGLLSLISQPLTITVSNPDGTKSQAFTEVAPARGDVVVGQ